MAQEFKLRFYIWWVWRCFHKFREYLMLYLMPVRYAMSTAEDESATINVTKGNPLYPLVSWLVSNGRDDILKYDIFASCFQIGGWKHWQNWHCHNYLKKFAIIRLIANRDRSNANCIELFRLSKVFFSVTQTAERNILIPAKIRTPWQLICCIHISYFTYTIHLFLSLRESSPAFIITHR